MENRICAVCGKEVARADEEDHLRSAHLGPHYFHLNGRRYRTMHPSMRCEEILRILELPMNAYLWEARDGNEVDYGHEAAINLAGQPNLFLEVHLGLRTLQQGRSPIEQCAL